MVEVTAVARVAGATLLLAGLCCGFYLPAIAPVSYCKAQQATDPKSKEACKTQMMVYVNRLNSLETVSPYEYNRFDFCPEENDDHSPVENLGQLVIGDRIRPSKYKFNFGDNTSCTEACKRTYKDEKESNTKLQFLRKGIRLNYQHHWIIDNMPITWCYNVEGGEKYCSTGFPIGCYVDPQGIQKDACVINPKLNKKDTYYIFNHVDITIQYNRGKGEDWSNSLGASGGRLISARLEPKSYSKIQKGLKDCGGSEPLALGAKQTDLEISYTYSVLFTEKNDVKWSSRWDYILESMQHTSIQWFSIMSSVVVVLFLTGWVAVIMFRTLHKDLARYNQMDKAEDAQEEFGWKSLHGDVFRPPRKGMMLAVLNGNGIQIFFMTLITLVFACLGFLSPANRGALMKYVLVLYACLGTPAGYVSARIYKTFGGEKWKSNALLTAFLCQGVIFGIFFLLDRILWIKQSSAAIPFTTLLTLLALWFGVSAPLTFVGAYFGFKKTAIEHPVDTNQIPRQIPKQPHHTKALPGIIMGGVLPFGCIFIQLFFILNSIWSNQMYYMFGFVFLVFVILVVTCSEATIILCNCHLNAEDYHWWWRSYLSSAFTSVYVFIYCIHYYMTKLEIQGAASAFLYFGYTLIIVFLFSLLTGAIGFCACFWFVSKIYSSAQLKT